MRVVKKTFLLLALVLLALPVPGGCGGTLVTEEFYQSYRVRSGTVLEIINPNGNVTVSGWDGDRVEISALKQSDHGREALEEAEIFIDIAETLKIKTEHPTAMARVTVDYEIKIPEDVTVALIESSNGDINLQGVSGNPVLLTSNGTITAGNINGIVSAQSSNGDITAIGVRGLGYLRTANGDIEAELPTLHEDLEIRTSNGSISLFLDPMLEANIEAETSNGTINIDNLALDISEQEQALLVGILNEGGPKIKITTSNGSINLARLR